MGAAKGTHARGLDPALPFHNVDLVKLLPSLCLVSAPVTGRFHQHPAPRVATRKHGRWRR